MTKETLLYTGIKDTGKPTTVYNEMEELGVRVLLRNTSKCLGWHKYISLEPLTRLSHSGIETDNVRDLGCIRHPHPAYACTP